MEITLISPNSIRLKTKSAVLIFDHSENKGKLHADGVLLLQNTNQPVEIKDTRLTISGVGEYEISGVKITGVKSSQDLFYYLTFDKVNLLFSKASSLREKENLKDVDISVIFADSLADSSILAGVTESVVIFYGPEAQNSIKKFGKEIKQISNYVITKDKLPSEMEVVWL